MLKQAHDEYLLFYAYPHIVPLSMHWHVQPRSAYSFTYGVIEYLGFLTNMITVNMIAMGIYPPVLHLYTSHKDTQVTLGIICKNIIFT